MQSPYSQQVSQRELNGLCYKPFCASKTPYEKSKNQSEMLFFHKRNKISLKPPKHFLIDLVILIGIVMTWRGIWHLADAYLFPNNDVLSSIVSITIGLILLYLPEEELKDLL